MESLLPMTQPNRLKPRPRMLCLLTYLFLVCLPFVSCTLLVMTVGLKLSRIYDVHKMVAVLRSLAGGVPSHYSKIARAILE